MNLSSRKSEQLSRFILSLCPTHGLKAFVSEAGSREDSNFMVPLWKAAVFLANVVEVFANCFVSMMSPSSARAASLTVILPCLHCPVPLSGLLLWRP